MTERPAYMNAARLAWELSVEEKYVSRLVTRRRIPAPSNRGGVKIWKWDDVDAAIQRRDHVYVVGFGPYVKIGMSRNRPQLRIAAIQSTCPEDLTVYGLLPGDKAYEGALHRRYSEYRTRGEWFRREGALADWIAKGCPL
jgi:hypothetical protein